MNTRCYCTVAGVQKIIEAYIVPGDTNYFIILERPWLRDVQAIGIYAKNEYWLKDEFGKVTETLFLTLYAFIISAEVPGKTLSHRVRRTEPTIWCYVHLVWHRYLLQAIKTPLQGAEDFQTKENAQGEIARSRCGIVDIGSILRDLDYIQPSTETSTLAPRGGDITQNFHLHIPGTEKKSSVLRIAAVSRTYSASISHRYPQTSDTSNAFGLPLPQAR